MTFHTLLSGAAFAALALVAAPAAAATCEDLAGVKLPDGVVESATPTAASDSIALGGSMPGLPAPAAFCRVKVRLMPTASSDIGVEVWLPEKAAWNGKFLGAGNGGYGGGFMGPFLMMRGGVVTLPMSGSSILVNSNNTLSSSKFAGSVTSSANTPLAPPPIPEARMVFQSVPIFASATSGVAST